MEWHLALHLQERADYEGRSLSNLISHMLEGAKEVDIVVRGIMTPFKAALKSSNGFLAISN